MERVRRGFGHAAGWTGLPALRAALSLPWTVLRILLDPREQPLSGLSDRQLADIGLGRADVDRFHERSASPELDAYQLLRRQHWL